MEFKWIFTLVLIVILFFIGALYFYQKKRMDYMESEITKMGKYLSDEDQYYQPTAQRQQQDPRLRYRDPNARLINKQPQYKQPQYQQHAPPVPTTQYAIPPEPVTRDIQQQQNNQLLQQQQNEQLLQQQLQEQQRQQQVREQQQAEQMHQQVADREYVQPQDENTITDVMESHVADIKGELCTIDGDCEDTLDIALKD